MHAPFEAACRVWARLLQSPPHRALFFVCLFFALRAFSLPAPQNELDLATSTSLIENKRVRAVRLSIPSHSAVSVRRLAHESLLVSLHDVPVQMSQPPSAPQRWQALPGSFLWVRGNLGFSLENLGNSPADLVSLELRDSYAFNQLSAPRSSLDPVQLDPRHFRSVLDNEHVRALLLHFGAREESPLAQFNQGVAINLSDVHSSHITPSGDHSTVSGDSSSLSWQPDGLYEIHNLDSEPFDSLFIEFKHPVCNPIDRLTRLGIPNPYDLSTPAETRNYIISVLDKVERQWRKSLPREAKAAEVGIVALIGKIQSDGSIREDDILPYTVYASDALVAAARAAIRKAAPFPPLPASFDKPSMEIAFTFFYNLSHLWVSCE